MKARRLISNGVLGYILSIIYNIKSKTKQENNKKWRSISSHTSEVDYDFLTVLVNGPLPSFCNLLFY
jgi:hypothetical protein